MQTKLFSIYPNNSFHNIQYFSALLFAFSCSFSRAAISFFIIWFVILFLIRTNYTSFWKQLKSIRVFWAMGFFLFFLLLSILWSEDKNNALNQIRLYGYWIIIPILAYSLKKEWLPNLITAFLAGMLISEIISYGIFFELWTFKDRTVKNPAPFMSYIHYSIFLAFTASLLLSRILSNRFTWKKKVLLALFFVTVTSNLMFSSGRTGQLAFFIAMLVIVIYHYRFSLRSLIIFIFLSITLFVGSYTIIDQFKLRVHEGIQDIELLEQGNLNTSWGLRAAFWIVSYDILQIHPIVGAGIGDYKLMATDVLQINKHHFSSDIIDWCSNTHFHNQYLMIIVQTGIIGFLLMLWLFFELFKLKIDDPELREFKILGLTIFIVASIAEPLWILQFPIILFVFITSLSLAASNIFSNKQY